MVSGRGAPEAVSCKRSRLYTFSLAEVAALSYVQIGRWITARKAVKTADLAGGANVSSLVGLRDAGIGGATVPTSIFATQDFGEFVAPVSTVGLSFVEDLKTEDMVLEVLA
jgi:hypothetical protein